MKKWQANIGLLMVAMLWGGSFIATDHIIENYFTPLNLQIIRNVFATAILVVIFFKKFISVSKKTVLIGALLGFLFLAGNTVQGIGLLETTVSKNAFLTANYALFIPFLSFIFFREKPTKFIYIGLVFMIIGYFFIIFEINVFDINSYKSLSSELKFTRGDFITIIAALLFALHIIAVNRFVKDQDPIQVLIFQLGFAGLIGIIGSLIFGTFKGENLNSLFQLEQFKYFMDFLPAMLYLVIFSCIICFGGQLVFQKYTDSSSAGILMSLESAFACIFAVIIGIDDFYTGLILGGIFVLFGVITAETNLDFLLKKKTVNS